MELKEMLKRYDELKNMLPRNYAYDEEKRPILSEMARLEDEIRYEAKDNTFKLERDEVWEFQDITEIGDDGEEWTDTVGRLIRTSLGDPRLTNNVMGWLTTFMPQKDIEEFEKAYSEKKYIVMLAKFHWDNKGHSHFVGAITDDDEYYLERLKKLLPWEKKSLLKAFKFKELALTYVSNGKEYTKICKKYSEVAEMVKGMR